MRLSGFVVSLLVLCIHLIAQPMVCTSMESISSDPSAERMSNAFFALCMDTHDTQKRTLEQQAQLLQELGFDGAGHLWLDQVPERLQTLDAAGMKLFQIYIRLELAADAPQPYDPKLKEILPLLKGRDTTIALLISGGNPSDESLDERAETLLREVADLANASGLRIALYPHTGDWLERVEDALRIIKKADRSNVGITFNLCHWLRVDKERNYKDLLEKALPRLFAVTINGADNLDDLPGWGRYIQPLGRGSFDMAGFLQTLYNLGYKGPIGLMGYGIEGDARDILSESMIAWRGYMAKIN